MKAVFQRVASAEVRSEGRVAGRIGPGAVVLLGVGRADTEADAAKLAEKVAKLRVFDDAEGKMTLPITAVPGGKIVVVSQFTLHGDAAKGNRPSYIEAARPEQAPRLELGLQEPGPQELGPGRRGARLRPRRPPPRRRRAPRGP